MGGVYLGLPSDGGYLFVTNDTFGAAEQEGAIVRINQLCGALIVTARGSFLIRVREVLDKCLSVLNGPEEGISIGLAQATVTAIEKEFQEKPHFRKNPLPFLLLLVGYRSKDPFSLEHIFIRNRVVDTLEKDGDKEYITRFDIQQPTHTTQLFYGHSELTEYLLRQVTPNSITSEMMKVLAYLALTETQKIDDSVFPRILMATLSRDRGFDWVREEEIHRLSGLAERVDRMLTGKLSSYFTSFGMGCQINQLAEK